MRTLLTGSLIVALCLLAGQQLQAEQPAGDDVMWVTKLSYDYYDYSEEYETTPGSSTAGTQEIQSSGDLEGSLSGATLSLGRLNSATGTFIEFLFTYRQGDVDGTMSYDVGALNPKVTADVEAEKNEYEFLIQYQQTNWQLGGIVPFFTVGFERTESEIQTTLPVGWIWTATGSREKTVERDANFGILGVGLGYKYTLVDTDRVDVNIGARVHWDGMFGWMEEDDPSSNGDVDGDNMWGSRLKGTLFVDVPISVSDRFVTSVFAEGGAMAQWYWTMSDDIHDELTGFYGRGGVRFGF